MTGASAMTASSDGVQDIARAFVAARQTAQALPGFPGTVPPTMADAYACQDAAIQAWPDTVQGWKVGRVAPAFLPMVGQERLAGPIFSRSVWTVAGSSPVEVPVFTGGFAAVEAEFVFRLLEDAPAGKLDWTEAEAASLPLAMHIGIEMAGSPLKTINDLGPTVVASDFGNNNGLLLGPVMPGWSDFVLEALSCQTWIDGVSVGTGSAAGMPGGPLGALAFLLGATARRGRPLTKGQLVTTGAITGIHDIEAGQSGRVSFGRWGELSVFAKTAAAQA